MIEIRYKLEFKLQMLQKSIVYDLYDIGRQPVVIRQKAEFLSQMNFLKRLF